MLTEKQLHDFETLGYFRIKEVFSKDAAGAMEDFLWQNLGAKYGARSEDAETWDFGPVTGFQSLHANKVFDPIGGTSTLAVIDELLGPGKWQTPSHWGQFLITFPTDNPWYMPSAWHTDFGFETPANQLCGVVMFSFLADVEPRGGGTLLIEGSHKLLAKYVQNQNKRFLKKMKNVRKGIMDSDPWLRSLNDENADADFIQSYMTDSQTIQDVHLKVVELSGEAGDIVFTHPWLLHSPAPNSGTRPRFMRVQRIHL